MDELNCLVVNITVPPLSMSRRGGPWPVMVFIHGGAFLSGSSNLPAYDMGRLVSHSVTIGKPVVGITISYRVRFGGFLASKVIRTELERDGFSGNGNFGLTDQQLALNWIQRYVHEFGGDCKNVTILDALLVGLR